MKKPVAIIGGIVLTAGILGLGYGGWRLLRDDTTADQNTVYVTTVSSLIETASGTLNRFAGVVEPQDTIEVKLESGRTVKEVKVKEGQEVKVGDVLFEYDLSSMEDDLTEKQLEYDQLVNEEASIKEQILTYTKERDKAEQDQKLSYTIQIETAKMSLRKNQYDQTSKAAELEKLKKSMTETEVRCEMNGVIKKIDTSKMNPDSSNMTDSGYYSGSNSSSNAFITILSTGAYRVKGKINEQNMQSIVQGAPVIIRSRVDENQIWRGTMGAIDTESSTNDNSNSYYMMGMTDTQTTSSSYAFYVELNSSEGLMLGQHVYIEMDEGQEDAREGIWLDEYFVVDVDTAPYVWGSTGDDKLKKMPVTLGEYDENLGKYQITGGLTENDCIAFPMDNLEEGMPTVINDSLQILDTTQNLGPYETDPTAGMPDGSVDMNALDDDPENMNEMIPIDGPDGGVLESAQEWTGEDTAGEGVTESGDWDMEDWEAIPMEEVPVGEDASSVQGEGVG